VINVIRLAPNNYLAKLAPWKTSPPKEEKRPNTASCAGVSRKRDRFVLFGPAHHSTALKIVADGNLVRDVFENLLNACAVGIDGEKFPFAVAVGEKQDSLAVGRPIGRNVTGVIEPQGKVAGHQVLIAAIGICQGNLPCRLLLDDIGDEPCRPANIAAT